MGSGPRIKNKYDKMKNMYLGTIIFVIEFTFPTESKMDTLITFKEQAEQFSDGYKLCFITSDKEKSSVSIYAREHNDDKEEKIIKNVRECFKKHFPYLNSF